MATYDSKKIRQAAREAAKLSDGMASGVKPELRAARERLPELKGRTMRAMEAQLEELLREGAGLEDAFDDIAHQLNAYADELEAIDEELAREM